MRISDWSSDVCSSDLIIAAAQRIDDIGHAGLFLDHDLRVARDACGKVGRKRNRFVQRIGVERLGAAQHRRHRLYRGADDVVVGRSEEHTSELQSLMRISYAVFCLKKKTNKTRPTHQ